MTSASPLSPPKHEEGQGRGLVSRATAEQLKAKLYATSDISNNTQPVLKVRRRPRQEEVSVPYVYLQSTLIPKPTQPTLQAKAPKLDPLVILYSLRYPNYRSKNLFFHFLLLKIKPALSAYQRKLHHDLHGPLEPYVDPKAKKPRTERVAPLKREASTSPLPDLPGPLAEKQKLLVETRGGGGGGGGGGGRDGDTSPVKSGKATPRYKSLLQSRPSALLLNSDPDSVITKYSPPLESVTDILEIIARLKKEPELGFLYLTPVVSPRSVHYNPYQLRVVVHSKVNTEDYCTLSLEGVTHLQHHREAEFTELDQWVADYMHFNKLIRIKTFAKFRLWKAFYLLRKNARWKYVLDGGE